MTRHFSVAHPYPTLSSCLPGGDECSFVPADEAVFGTLRGVSETARFGPMGGAARLSAYVETWAPNGTPTSVLHGNGGRRVVELDEQERVARISVQKSSGGLLWDSGLHVYDGLSQLLSVGREGTPGTDPQVYLHDAHGRLIQAALPGGVVDYAFDGFGNLTGRTGSLLPSSSPGTFSARRHHAGGVHDNRIHEPGFEHDASGNLTLMPSPTRSMKWDVQGRLLRVTDGAGVALSRMAYDPAGERLLAEAGGELRYYHRGGAAAVLAEYVRDGDAWVLDKEFVDGVDGPLGEVQEGAPGPSVRYHGRDHLGTPRVLTDGSGTPTSVHVLEPFGMDVPGAADWETTHRFTGHERDDATGLDYMHARYYSAELGRFLSCDPRAGDQLRVQSWGRFAYVMNNPLGLLDPDGTTAAEDDARQRAAQGAAVSVGTQATNDAAVRAQYQGQVSQLQQGVPGASAARTAAKQSARAATSPAGQVIAEIMAPASGEAALVAGTVAKTNAGVDAAMSAAGKAGPALLVVGAGVSTYNIATADEPTRALAQESGAWAGALACGALGAEYGAQAGAAIGVWVGGVGAVPGGVIGGVVGAVAGGVVGALTGKKTGEVLYDNLTP